MPALLSWQVWRTGLAGWLLCASPPAAAETIRLTNGRTLEGTIVKETDDHLVVDVGIGRVTLSRAQVAGLGPAPRRSLSATPARADVPGAALLLPIVAELAGRSVRGAVATRLVDRAFIRDLVASELRREYPDDALRRRQRAYARLDILPPSTDLAELLTRLYTQQAAGLYDPRTDTLYLADWTPAPLRETTVAHELVHALQDQATDLSAFFQAVQAQGDATAARQAVVEGEAVVVMQEHLASSMLRRSSDAPEAMAGRLSGLSGTLGLMGDLQAQLAQVPSFFQDSLLFPYRHGTVFVEQVRQADATRSIARAYQDPPGSTEQILHPEKYLSHRDTPTAIGLPATPSGAQAGLPDAGALAGEGWRVVDTDVLGEAGLRAWLRPVLGDEAAAQASAGWDGDRYVLYDEPARRGEVLALLSVWDREQDAVEWQKAVSIMFPHAMVERHAARVVVLEGLAGVPADVRDTWQTWAWRVWPSERTD